MPYRHDDPFVVATGSGPLAFVLTVPTYGTWLHGDERGSVDRKHNTYGTAFLDPNPARRAFERSLVRPDTVLLDAASRTIIRTTIEEVARHRGWYVHAAAVRTNHMHIVVTAMEKPEPVLNAFKSWATRRLREAGLIPKAQRTWVRHGSTRYLWTMAQVTAACRYVCEGQGHDLPEVDRNSIGRTWPEKRPLPYGRGSE